MNREQDTYHEYSFSTFLTGYLSSLSALLFGILFFWVYLSTNQSLHQQQSLNVQLNNQNSVQVLEDYQEDLLNTLQLIANRFAARYQENNTKRHPLSLKDALPEEVTSMFDLLRFFPANNTPVQQADTPFFDFEQLELTEQQVTNNLLSTCRLLYVKTKNDLLVLVAASLRVIEPNSGRVQGYLVGGAVLNDNLPLMREILQHSNARHVILEADGHLLASSAPLPNELIETVMTGSQPLKRTTQTTEESKHLLISNFTYSLNGSPLNIRFVYPDIIFKKLQKTFISTGLALLLATAALFLSFYLLSKRKAQKEINSLLAYTRTVTESPETARFMPGKFSEFNQVGKAIDKMVQRFNAATSELKETKERLEMIIAGADLGTWDWNIGRDEVTFNERWCEMLGYTLAEIEPEKSTWEKLIHPDDKKRVLRALNQHLEGTSPFYLVEHRLKHRQGHWVWVMTAGKVLHRDTDGSPLRAAGIHLDISRQKTAEEALIKERALLEAMINSIPDLFFYKDTNSVYLGCNKAFEELVDKDVSEIIGKTDFDLFPEKLARFIRRKDREMLKAGHARRNEERVIYPDGRQVLLDTLKTTFVGPGNEVMGLIGVSRDITSIKETEQNLEAERERLAVTLRSIGDGVITTDIEGNIVLLNKAAERLTGWTNEDATGQAADKILPLYDSTEGDVLPTPAKTAMRLDRTFTMESNAILIAKDGRSLHISISGAPIHDRKSEIVGAVIVVRDITDQQRLEEEMLKTRKLESIGVLAGGIAHDFNNILSAILGNLELCSALLPEDTGKPRTLLENAQKATTRAAKLTQQLLTFSKGGEPIKEATSLPRLIEESADFVLHGSSVTCHYDFPEDLWMVDADAGQISQVIQNIIINAKHAMPNGGTIQVTAENMGLSDQDSVLKLEKVDFVKISVADQGEGIPDDIIDKIFDPYFTTKDEGSGLGLAISHSIITKHGGHLTAQSIQGKGTVFQIYLRKAGESRQSGMAPSPGSSLPFTLRIMVMDDEEMLRNLAAEQLTQLGHEPHLVSNGEEAKALYLESRQKGKPMDVVILDLTIRGGMGGLETSVELLQIDPEAIIIVASGYSNDPVMSRYREYGFRGAVVKPFDIKTLDLAIQTALQTE